MNLKCVVFIYLSSVTILAVAAPKDSLVLARDGEDEKPSGFISALLSPVLNLVRRTTTRTVEHFKDAAAVVDTHVSTAQKTISQIASEIGRNALGDVIDNMRLFRGRVRRFLNVVKGAQKSIQNVMDNKGINGVFRATLVPLSVGLATLQGQVAGLDVVVNAGANNLPDSED